MTRPLLLDLFCGAGGAATGYHRAGFDVVGVDNRPQPHYPFRFILADAIQFALDLDWDQVQAVHASPPCKLWSTASRGRGPINGHIDLITPMRPILKASGRAWVMENVPGTPLRPDVMLCGEMFGLDVRRHRWFETEPSAFGLIPSCTHDRKVVSVHGRPGGTSTRDGRLPTLAEWKAAMGIDWMSGRELSQAIPPAYTEFIGGWLMSAIGVSA